MMEKLPKADRELLPELVETTEALYARAMDLARTLNDLDQGFQGDERDRIRRRLEDMKALEPGEERDRQMKLLEQQLKTAG